MIHGGSLPPNHPGLDHTTYTCGFENQVFRVLIDLLDLTLKPGAICGIACDIWSRGSSSLFHRSRWCIAHIRLEIFQRSMGYNVAIQLICSVMLDYLPTLAQQMTHFCR